MDHKKVPTSFSEGFAFSKYHGNGNDFILVDLKTSAAKKNIGEIQEEFCRLATSLCARFKGIGADGIILLSLDEQSLSMRVINSDGSIAKNCGNGLRCAAAWFFSNNLARESVDIELAGKIYACQKVGDDIDVSMGECQVSVAVEHPFKCYKISLGNKHLVVVNAELTTGLEKLLKKVEDSFGPIKDFNVGFVGRDQKGKIKSQVFERGAGFTLSCASGACAAAVAMHEEGEVKTAEYLVEQPGGNILVVVKREGSSYWLTQKGSAQKVFEGFYQA